MFYFSGVPRKNVNVTKKVQAALRVPFQGFVQHSQKVNRAAHLLGGNAYAGRGFILEAGSHVAMVLREKPMNFLNRV
ncbi:hypothetical protein CYR40_01770 [Chimaeribacter arupi]|nr:hypothetical protein CYR40_01770 [Chimaeribacter arupi]